MGKFLVKRLAQALLVFAFVTVVIFVCINLAPGDPYIQRMNPNITPELREELLRKWGYYDPLYIKYFKWIAGVLQGDFGYSIAYKAPVSEVILQRLPNTIILGLGAFILSNLIAIPCGIVSATKRNSLFDYSATILSFLGLSIPSFFFGLIMIKVFAVDLHWFPISGMITVGKYYEGWANIKDILSHLILPLTVLSLVYTAKSMRYTRSSLLEVMSQDYIRTARAKGLQENKVVNIHGLKNALIPVITVTAMQIPMIVSGAVLIETIFVWPGVGLLSYNAILDRDYPLIMALLFMTSLIILLSNILADILYALVDPRVRYDK